MIVLDTTRQDHLGCYGHSRDTSPSIDAFAADAIRFDRAYATAPWTKPTVASMFTGLYPSRHSVRVMNAALPDRLLTLSEILGARGYATAGVISHVLLDRRHGFAQGFEKYVEVVDPEDPHESVTSDRVTDAALEILSRFDERQPFFLFVHYFDPHYNYKRHPEYGFAPPKAGRLKGTETIYGLYDFMPDMTREEIDLIEAIYDEEIRFMDDGVGRLLESLKKTVGFEDTLVLIAGDHGEEFMTHGHIGHTISLYEEVMLVPLIMRPPGYRAGGTVVDLPVSLVSIAPTVLDLIGVEIEGLVTQGTSLAAALDPEAPAGRDPVVFCETDEQRHKRAVIVGRDKLIRNEESGKIELYDIVADPGELDDRSGEQPERVAQLLAMLEQSIVWAAEGSIEPDTMTLTDEQREQLRSLGYVGN
jgi:arylsulfatase A-like enzyme